MSVKKSILKNGISAAFQKGIKVAEQLLLVPFFIQYWGADYYGDWLTLTVVPSVLALSDFGFGTAVANTFLLKYAGGDKQGAADVAKTGITIISLLIIVAILLSFLVIIILHRYGIFDKTLIPANQAVLSVLILLIARIINFYQALFGAYFSAARKANISINFQSIVAVANMISGLLVLWSGGGVVEYASAMLILALLGNPVYIFNARRVLPLHHTHRGKIDKNAIKPLIKKGLGYFLSPIWQAIYYQGMTFVVRITLGAVAVTAFNTLRTLVRSSAQAFAMAITAVYPDFQFEMAVGNTKKAKTIFLGVLALNILISIGFVITLGFIGEELYNWWTKNTINVPKQVWFTFITSICFYALWFTFSFIFEALNKPYTNTKAGFICASVAVLIAWLLCQHIGLIGVALGCLTFDILMCFYISSLGINELKITWKELLAIPHTASHLLTGKLINKNNI